MLPVGAVASRRGRAPEAVRLVQTEPARVPVVALVGNRRLAAAAVVVEGVTGRSRRVRARARARARGLEPPSRRGEFGAFSARSSWPYGTRSTCSKCERAEKDRPRGGEASRPSRGARRRRENAAPGRIDGARRYLRAARVRHARGARARGLHLAHAGAPLGHAALHLRRRRRGALHRDEAARARPPPGTGADVRPWGAPATCAAWARRTPCSRRARGPRSSERPGRRRTRRLRGTGDGEPRVGARSGRCDGVSNRRDGAFGPKRGWRGDRGRGWETYSRLRPWRAT